MMCIDVVFFMFLMPGLHCDPFIYKFIVIIKFGKLLAITSSNIFSVSCSVLFLRDSNDVYIKTLEVVLQFTKALFVFFCCFVLY